MKEILILILFCFITGLGAQEYFVVTASNDLFGGEQTKILTEVLSYNLYEKTGASILFIEERDSRLSRWNMSDQYTDALAADWESVFPGAGFFVLELSKSSTLDTTLRFVQSRKTVFSVTLQAANYQELLSGLDDLAGLAAEKLGKKKLTAGNQYYGQMTIRFRFDVPETGLVDEKLIHSVQGQISQASLEAYAALFFEDFFTGKTTKDLRKTILSQRRPDHYYFAIISEGQSSFLICMNSRGEEISRIPIPTPDDKRITALVRSLIIDQLLLIREFEDKYKLVEAIETLMAEEDSASKNNYLSVWDKTTTSALAGLYQPMPNLISAAIDYEYYYSGILGIGGGYAFSIAYPGVIDDKLATHPLVFVHDFNFYPLIIKTLGDLSFVLSLETGLRFHNSYKITYHVSSVVEYTDYKEAILFKIGPKLGIRYKLTDEVYFLTNLIDMHYIIPLAAPELGRPLNLFGADIVGMGISFTF